MATYRDISLSFARNPQTNDIVNINDVNAVKRSLRNLILMEPFDSPFQPNISSGVKNQLFENYSPITSSIIARQIEDVISNYEPRAQLVGVRVIPTEKNTIDINIDFYVLNAPTQVENLSILLERVR